MIEQVIALIHLRIIHRQDCMHNSSYILDFESSCREIF